MIKTFLTFTVDEEFRRTQKCALCEELIGDADFMVSVPFPRADHLADYAERTNFCTEVTYQHINCVRLGVAASDAADGITT
jgi:hypothetical protein